MFEGVGLDLATLKSFGFILNMLKGLSRGYYADMLVLIAN